MIGRCFKVKSWKDYLKGFVTGMLFIGITIGISTAQAARQIRIQDFNTIVWVFVVVGALVILLQLIPAFLLFLSFITGVYNKSKQEQEQEQEEIVIPKDAVKDEVEI